jgi:hypothetical protein
LSFGEQQVCNESFFIKKFLKGIAKGGRRILTEFQAMKCKSITNATRSAAEELKATVCGITYHIDNTPPMQRTDRRARARYADFSFLDCPSSVSAKIKLRSDPPQPYDQKTTPFVLSVAFSLSM